MRRRVSKLNLLQPLQDPRNLGAFEQRADFDNNDAWRAIEESYTTQHRQDRSYHPWSDEPSESLSSHDQQILRQVQSAPRPSSHHRRHRHDDRPSSHHPQGVHQRHQHQFKQPLRYEYSVRPSSAKLAHSQELMRHFIEHNDQLRRHHQDVVTAEAFNMRNENEPEQIGDWSHRQGFAALDCLCIVQHSCSIVFQAGSSA